MRTRKRKAEKSTPRVEPEELPLPLAKVFDAAKRVFLHKNSNYRSLEKWDANFHEATPVVQGLFSPLMYCMTLAAKQDDAFWRAIALGESDANFNNIHERLMDGAIYRLIALAILTERKQN